MKILSLICIIGGVFFVYSVFPNYNVKESQIKESQIQDPIRKEVSVAPDSISWFEKHLDIYIEKHLFTFNPTKYVQEPTDKIKEELSLECWLGNFTISDMTSSKYLIIVDCSNEEKGFNKLIYITPNFFVITLYFTSEDGVQYGSSLVYYPENNTLDKLESIVTYGIRGWILSNNNILECSRKKITQDGFLIEYGQYNTTTKKFVVEYSE